MSEGPSGTGHAVALSSGTAGLHLALLEVGVGPGDEVICPTLTFAASANAIRYCGAEPVFLDVDEHRWCLDAGLLADELAAAAGCLHRRAGFATGWRVGAAGGSPWV